MRRGGRPTRKRRGGSSRPARPMRRGGSARPARPMRRGGSARPARAMRRGGSARPARPARAMRRGGSARPMRRGGRPTTRRFQSGGRTGGHHMIRGNQTWSCPGPTMTIDCVQQTDNSKFNRL